ncbi:MAG: type II toxin-antitoxin system PemK/MazF family toxin [Clostridiales bacterium]|jgi:mRNA interferase MazF|nr:type II toxin-antitoxin system PemK/MazF family toxin [Clostridiales bacterium]
MVNKWEIYFCSLDPTVGSEQKGSRPVLVISSNHINHNIPVSTVIPLSAFRETDKLYPTELVLHKDITNLPKTSVAMVQQIRTVSHERLSKLAGKIDDEKTKSKLLDILIDYFDIKKLF